MTNIKENYKWTVDIAFIPDKNEWHFCICIPSNDNNIGDTQSIFGMAKNREEAIDAVTLSMKNAKSTSSL